MAPESQRGQGRAAIVVRAYVGLYCFAMRLIVPTVRIRVYRSSIREIRGKAVFRVQMHSLLFAGPILGIGFERQFLRFHGFTRINADLTGYF